MTDRPSRAVRATETLLTAAGGAALGTALGLPGGMLACVATGVAAGINGALGGWRQIYHWRTARGWLCFAADSTWGLVGTTLGTVLHLVNLALPGAAYRGDCSRRRNRHWFDGGARLRRGFVLTLGNVVSSTPSGRRPMAEEHRRAVERHEDLHIWQNRAFGPLYPAAYAAWSVVGTLVGVLTWVARRGEPGLVRLVETAAYYDNPFEFWAYKRDGRWEANRADPVLKWRRPGSRRRAKAPEAGPPATGR
jgi:hypothetical protein